MVTCDVFELKLNLTDGDTPAIDYVFYTDLPAGTRVVLSCQRTFVNMRDEQSLWVGYNEALEVKPSIHGDYNGGRGRIDVVSSDKKALQLFNQINSSLSPGIKSSVSDAFTVVLTVGARQRLRQFGKKNSELSGQMVSKRGDISVIEVSRSVHVPMKPSFQPLVG